MGDVVHASEAATERERNRAAKRPRPATEPPAEWLLALQRGAGNQAVARHVARARTLARVDVKDVQEECERDRTFAQSYAVWLRDKQDVTGLSEGKLVADLELPRLKEMVQQADTHVVNAGVVKSIESRRSNEREQALAERARSRKSFLGGLVGAIEDFFVDDEPFLDLRAIIEGQLLLLAKSPTLQRFAGGALGKLSGIVKNIQILQPKAFDQKYIDEMKGRELTVADALVTADYATGFTVSGVVCLRYGSGANFASIHSAVHECIHALASPGVPGAFGQNLNEGVTETITRIVMGEVGPTSGQEQFWAIPDSYSAQRTLVERLLQQPDLKAKGLPALMDVYFNYLFADPAVTKAVKAFSQESGTVSTPIIK